MNEIYVYHVVTDKPMYIGQHIIFDNENHSGVYDRVMSKRSIVILTSVDKLNNMVKYSF